MAMVQGLKNSSLILSSKINPMIPAGRQAINTCLLYTSMADVEKGMVGSIPRHLQNKHFDGEDQEVKGQFYIYPQNCPNHWTEQQYLPDTLKDARYYEFGDNKNEQAFRQYWENIKGKKL